MNESNLSFNTVLPDIIQCSFDKVTREIYESSSVRNIGFNAMSLHFLIFVD